MFVLNRQREIGSRTKVDEKSIPLSKINLLEWKKYIDFERIVVVCPS